MLEGWMKVGEHWREPLQPHVIAVKGEYYTAFGDEHTPEDFLSFAVDAWGSERVLAIVNRIANSKEIEP